MEKIRKILFSCIFVVLITFIGVYVMFIKTPTTRLAMDLRDATQFIGPTLANVSDGFFQSTFENAFQDQFIKRQEFIQAYRKIEHALYNVSILDKKDMTLVKIGNDVYTFEANNDYLTGWPIFKNDTFENGIDKFTSNVNEIADKYDDVNFYVYKPFRITESNWFDADNDFESYGEYYEQKLINGLSDKVIYADNEIDDFEEYQKYYFKTDPHWNIYGSYEGYKLMVDMFNKNYGDMVPQEYSSVFTFDDFAYYGQYGRNSSYLTSPDVFSDLNFDNLPNYLTFVNGVETKYDRKDEFKNNEMEEFYWTYIYSVFHGNDENEVHFVEENNTGRKLLCFVDSYSSPIKYLIASHFDEAYFIDPRIYKDFNFREFMETHDITDVCYFAFYGSLYEGEWYTFEDY